MSEGIQFIQEELKDLKEKLKKLEDAELITCVPSMVRIHITKTAHKNLAICWIFPNDYPNSPIVTELKSKVFSTKLLDGLTKMCDAEAKKHIGRQQIILIAKFVDQFLEENPLCVCSDEISYIKNKLITEKDEFKLKQKNSQVIMKLSQDNYYFTVKCSIPLGYHSEQMKVEITSHNFPEIFLRNFLGQANEIARRHVTPPLRKRPKDPPFEPSPSLKPVADFLIRDCIRRLPGERCPCCGKRGLPKDPQNIITDEHHDMFAERVYCGHIYHHKCLDVYMKTPPFEGGKKCPACGKRIYHEKWGATPQIAEQRWAHKEAKKRELDEVVDFLDS
ncbi:unnamed protein product [Owenia fusiformis]|uniref:Uncharacterized protein n=1 Tax=Owenia fusiformis TaxID=6347 RepID=A0A8J1XI34_OWEFU|nr:unnamed protein product [Owenia fusiformis]